VTGSFREHSVSMADPADGDVGAIEFRFWLPLVEAFRTLLISLDADMLALIDGREIPFDYSPA
jgi:hypothetical protein